MNGTRTDTGVGERGEGPVRLTRHRLDRMGGAWSAGSDSVMIVALVENLCPSYHILSLRNADS